MCGALALLLPGAAAAELPADFLQGPSPSLTSGASVRTAELPPYLQCVPFARQVSGIQIFGDAYTWWQQAAGRYARGGEPRVGAVMAFRPHANMKLGHVAAVSKVLDERTVLLDHANWSPIEGRRGQIERGVKAVDVSPAGDWSQVRVWYDPIQGLGTTAWPVEGFIYRSVATSVPGRVSAPALAVPAPNASVAPAPKPNRDVIGEIIRAAR
ncbi:MAG: hypothetical protein B7Z08_10505 [Sphingomonadales bacterium 32-68-7]|nr:MAG: hypothetical protein B7Z33_07225 [Sphingomonadales bacterium 12-68-11]OYX08203.1 MAG: hypothetical protein B7Z08_10505 [Sphingomonadales bacterium 32-68-7]